jgi:hypothetical protein
MSIYNRDNINYSGMIANMLAAKQRGIEAEKANTLAQGQIWSDLVNKLGGMAGRYVASRQVDEDEELLKKLEQERQQLIDQQKLSDAHKLEDYIMQHNAMHSDNMQDYNIRPNTNWYQQRNDANAYANMMEGHMTPPDMSGYRSSARTAAGNIYALPGDSNSTQSDYVKYIQAMNKLYGGV